MSSGMKKFLLLWIGELISSIGGGLTSFGLGVYVFQKNRQCGRNGLGDFTWISAYPSFHCSGRSVG